ncbi:MAG: hypothetical protein H6512_02550 [Acidimicrobiia bacterium]|nr:hypothetical protein [Acidimicrobiia bacterium]
MARIDVTLPALGESVTEGLLTQWLVDVGDVVDEDQPIFEISTDKIDTEVPAPASGTVVEIRAAAGDEVEIGSVVAVIETDAGAVGDTQSPAQDSSPQTPAPNDESVDPPAEQAHTDTPPSGAEQSRSTDRNASTGPAPTGPTPTGPSPARPSANGPSVATTPPAASKDTKDAEQEPAGRESPVEASGDPSAADQAQADTEGDVQGHDAPSSPTDTDRSAPPRSERIPRSYLSTAVADHVAQSWARIPRST